MTCSALILLPSALDPISDPASALPAPVLSELRALNHFVVEDAKSARAWLKRCAWPKPLTEAHMLVWNEHTASHPAIAQESIAKLLEWLNQGYPVGLLSDAGLPAVADPGQALIAAVHRAGYRVRPHIGPSSIMLALMASGLNGQHFEFKGYLPADTAAREAALGAIEALSQKDGRSVIWIETPYRNDAMMTSIIRCLKADTEVCVATALGTEKQSIHTRTVADWRRRVWQPGREPSVFILGCQPALTQAAVATEHLKTHRRKHP